MSLRTSLKARIAAPSGPELEQAILRIVILSIVTLYVAWFVSHPETILVGGLAGWLVLALVIFAVVWISPSANRARLVLGMLADVGAVTFGLLLAGRGGATLVGVYFFLIFGNGFRYGRAYLHTCQFLCLAGFGLVVSMVPWWQSEWSVVVGWMISLIVLPSYVGLLADRIDAARVKAEEALKECVERGRSAA
jgi:two-component system sensor histidine kinase RpfC